MEMDDFNCTNAENFNVFVLGAPDFNVFQPLLKPNLCAELDRTNFMERVLINK